MCVCLGAIGTVKQMFKNRESNRVVELAIQFDHDKTKYQNVQQVTADYMRGPTLFTRTQIPVILSYSVTTHKSQGKSSSILHIFQCKL